MSVLTSIFYALIGSAELKGTKNDQDDNQMDDGMMNTEEQQMFPQAMTELINVNE